MQNLKWWQRGVLYEIYPRSFQDSDGNGVGDLPGILHRLHYLMKLGVDAIWISPFYPSPMADFGYDVADYCGVDPLFGSLADFDRLVAAAHSAGLKVIIDFVPNHTSSQHPWFLESRAARDNPRRDWYLWRDPGPQGSPPNNWLSNFGGSGWEWDPVTQQYYYHSFLREQPDLNWRNPEVRDAMYNVLRFWLNRGVDGFRVDVIWLLIKDDQFRDNPPNPGYIARDASHNRLLPLHTSNRPETHDIVAQMRSVIDAYPERVLIGEIYLPVHQLVAYYGTGLNGADLPFNFQLIETAWNAERLARLIQEYEEALPPGAWPNWVLGNHDKSRVATRIGESQARVAAMLLLTLRGTPTIYYGEELGMKDAPISPQEVQDPAEKNEPGLGLGRDPERTPMPWDGTLCAGFSRGNPWLPLAPDYASRNVSLLRETGNSILNLYRGLIELRRNNSALSTGAITAVAADGDILRYERHLDAERIAVTLNVGKEAHEVAHPKGRVMLSTCLDRRDEEIDLRLSLRPAEGIVARIG
jgi:alpha-glucosidase